MPPIRRLGAIITRSNDGAVLSPQSIVGGIVLMPYSNASPARSLAGVLPVEAANQGFGVIVGHLSPRYRMTLLGAFRLSAPDGQRLEITSKKAIALLALLSTAETGERWRSWLQERLWGSLEPEQAQAGLRRELYRLRRLTENLEVPLLHSDFRAIRLNLSFVDVDIRQVGGITANAGEFLEGIDIPGEDAFEDWLRETRSCSINVGSWNQGNQASEKF